MEGTDLTLSPARLSPRDSGRRKKLVEISPGATFASVRIVNWAIPVEPDKITGQSQRFLPLHKLRESIWD